MSIKRPPKTPKPPLFEGAPVPAPGPPIGSIDAGRNTQSKALKLVTTTERVRREALIEQMMCKGLTLRRIAELSKQHFGISRQTTVKYVERIKGQWAAEAVAEGGHTKNAAIKRAQSVLQELREEPTRVRQALLQAYRAKYQEDPERGGKPGAPVYNPDTDLELQEALLEHARVDVGAVLSWEKWLGELQGSREPPQIQVNVQIQENVLHVIGNMSQEDYERALDEARENQRLAALARQNPLLVEANP